MISFKKAIIPIVAVLFSGCQVDGEKVNSTNFQSTMEVNDINVNYSSGLIKMVEGKIVLTESNENFSDVTFNDFNLSLDDDSDCEIENVTFNKEELSNGEETSFTLTTKTNCEQIDDLVLNTNERVIITDVKNTEVIKNVELTNTVSITKIQVSSDDNLTVNQIILSPKSFSITKNLEKTINIITVDQNQNPISATVKVSVPVTEDDELYGTFDQYEIATDESGQGEVVYTSPENFEDFSGTYNVVFSNTAANIFSTLSLEFVTQDENETNATDYELKMSASDSIQVDDSDTVVFQIVEKDDDNTLIEKTYVNSVTVTSLINGYLQFDNSSEEVTYSQSSSKSLDVFSDTTAGIDVLEVTANIFNGEENVTITDTFPVTISSGPISSISIIYSDSEYDNVFFNDTFTLHAVDKFGNPGNAGEKIYAGVVVGLTRSGSTELFFHNNGTISSTNGATLTLTGSTLNFNGVEIGENVVILASDEKLEGAYLGGWTVASTTSSSLAFESDYVGESVSGLRFLVGDEKRYDECELSLKVADIDDENATYVIDENGNATLNLRYDPYLVGKDVYIYANSYSNERVGTSIRKKLWGTGISASTSTCTGGEDYNVTCTLGVQLSLNDSPNYLQKTQIGDFSFEDGSVCYDVEVISDVTDCAGFVYVRVMTPEGETCTAGWNGTLKFEH